MGCRTGAVRRNPLWAALLLACAGCSIIAVRPTPTVNERTGIGVCATYLPPAIDVIGVPGFALLGAGLSSLSHAIGECGGNSTEPRCQTPWQVYIPAGIFALSAIYGFWATHHCNGQLEAMHEQYLRDHPGEIAPPAQREPVLPPPGIGR